jgi:putative ABC transport system permease protein
MVRVAIIGPVTATNLFDTDDPLGQIIKINGINFRVVGILKSKGDQGWFSPDDQIMIPYTTGMKQVFGVDYLREIDVQAAEGANTDEVQNALTAVLRKRHRIEPDAADDFQIRNQADMIQTATQITETFTLLLGGIAGISLIVGGIGIMNIMLVTVTERTREIGIRKAIGAKRKSIRTQFLLESMIISGLGGAIGVGVGVAAAAVMAVWLTQFTPRVEIPSAVMAFSFSVLVGVFFGWYPAARASKLDPVVALRYE